MKEKKVGKMFQENLSNQKKVCYNVECKLSIGHKSRKYLKTLYIEGGLVYETH